MKSVDGNVVTCSVLNNAEPVCLWFCFWR